METTICYLDRLTKKEEVEQIYGGVFIHLLYGPGWVSQLAYHLLLPAIAKIPLFSRMYGWIQKSRWSKQKVIPFIKKFHVDSEEFLDPVSSFQSFNDFFIRKLKPESRPIAHGNDVAVLPADARYLLYPRLDEVEGFLIKGKKFSMSALLQDALLAEKYQRGSMVIARLCPVDYHRFHFPIHCEPSAPEVMQGSLYSVNPIALRKNIDILTENKRMITRLHTKHFGTVLYIEVGATYVGSIHQTFVPGELYAKGEEKGYFAFGGSCLLLLFEPSSIHFDQDLIEASQKGLEIRGQMGQSLGRALSPI